MILINVYFQVCFHFKNRFDGLPQIFKPWSSADVEPQCRSE